MSQEIHLSVGAPIGETDSRNKEFAYCLERNITNPRITSVAVCIEEAELEGADPRNALLKHSKVSVVRLGRRAVMSDHIKILSGKPGLKCFANSDIYFDHTLGQLDGLKLGKTVLMLTRADHLRDNLLYGTDAWMFESPPEVEANIRLGYLGCDGKFFKMLHDAGYPVLNPSFTVRTQHLHKVRRAIIMEEYIMMWLPECEIHVCDINHGKISNSRILRYRDGSYVGERKER